MPRESKFKVGDRVEVIAEPNIFDEEMFEQGQTGVVVEVSPSGWWHSVDLDGSPGNIIHFSDGELVHRDL